MPFCWRQGTDARCLSLEEGGQSVLGQSHTVRGEPDQDAPAVTRVRVAFDKSGRLQTVEPHCHSPCGEQQRFGELGRCQLIWRPGPVEVGENLEITSMAQTIRGGDAVQSGLEIMGRPQHPGDHLDRGEVELGTTLFPFSDYGVDSVASVFTCCHWLVVVNLIWYIAIIQVIFG